MRFHVVAMPHTQTTWDFSACAYTVKVINFCRMMKDRGHTVFLYAGEDNIASCTEHIVCISKAERRKIVGDQPYVNAPIDGSLPHWIAFNARATAAIAERAKPQDFVCLIMGLAQKQVADSLPALTAVEFGVGYAGVFSRNRVFESQAWMHMHYGAAAGMAGLGNVDGNAHAMTDAVIPGYLDPDMFDKWRPATDPYFAFIGRPTERKGFGIARDICQQLGMPLVLAGGDFGPGYGEQVGMLHPTARAVLLSHATALFAPTLYVEPFGNVVIEAQASGVPAITTDWGAFTETVVQGVNGWRCRTYQEFLDAARAALDMDKSGHDVIRTLALSRYSLDVVGLQYERYFERLLDLWGEGWYKGRVAPVPVSP